MKKTIGFSMIVVFVLFSFAACGKNTGTPGTAANAMLKLLPKAAQGVILIDVRRGFNTAWAEKTFAENKAHPKYQEFVKETGIDPKTDIYFVAVALAAPSDMTKQEAAVLVNLKYNKDVLLEKIRKGPEGIKEENYNGVTVFSSAKGESGKPSSGAFLDASTIVVGNDSMVKAVIDVSQKKAENVLKNEKLAGILKTVNKSAIAWIAFAIPEEATKKIAEKNPMMGSLEGMKALTMFFDYRDKSLIMEIRLMGGEQAKNKQLADMLSGLKALGAGAAAKNPDIGEVMNRIEISSGQDFVKINAGLPEDLLQKLTKSAARKVEGMIQPKPEAEKEAQEDKED